MTQGAALHTWRGGLCVLAATLWGLALPTARAAAAELALERGRLPNGLRYAVVQLPPGSQGAITVVVEAGPAFEPAGSPGLAYLAARTLAAGTITRSPEAVGAELARVGGRMIPYLGPEWMGLTVVAPDKAWERAARLAADLIRNPAYPGRAVEEAARAAERDRDDGLADPRWYVNWQLLRLLAGETGYGRLLDQKPTALSYHSAGDLRRFHAERFNPSTAVIVVGASAPFARVKEALRQAFGDWTGSPSVKPVAPRVPGDPPGGLTLVVNRPGGDVFVGWQRTAPPIAHEHAHAYLLLLAILKQRLQATSVPGAAPWAPQVGYLGLKRIGWVRVTWQGHREDLAPRVNAVLAELRRLRSDPPAALEIRQARGRVEANLEAMMEPGPRLVWHLGVRELLGMGARPLRDYREALARVTPESLRELAREWLDPGRSAIVFLGDIGEMGPGLESTANP